MHLHPPLACSLQNFETCLFLISLEKFPSALVACASAWEAVLKAKLDVLSTDEPARLIGVIEEILNRSEQLAGRYELKRLQTFTNTRNRIVHQGFSPEEDEPCVALLLKTGLPFLNDCYRYLFDFYLDSHDIDPSITDLTILPPEQLEKVGLWPAIAAHLRYAGRSFELGDKMKSTPRAYCFRSLGHYIRVWQRYAWMTEVEYSVLESAKLSGESYERELRLKTQISPTLGSTTWFFNCPVCGGVEGLVVGINEHNLRAKKVNPKGGVCVKCGFSAGKDQPYLLDVLLEKQVKEDSPEILKRHGTRS